MRHYSLFLILITFLTFSLNATERRGHLGVGVSNQLRNGIPTLSLKFQGSRTFTFETLANLSTSDDGGFAAGIKIHRILFDEPQLNFYIAGLIALEQKKTAGIGDTGFQADLTCGSEFHFAGLRSLAFSLDFGLSVYKFENMIIETTGSGFITAGIHFYL
jgi:hypothetical protein